jgi:AcrR family transcriptional regulator
MTIHYPSALIERARPVRSAPETAAEALSLAALDSQGKYRTIGQSGRLTWAELDVITRNLADMLHTVGICPSDRVACSPAYDLDIVLAVLGVVRTGGIAARRLETVLDQPWRERVVTRSLGPAIRRCLDRAQAAIRATLELVEAGRPVTVEKVADSAGISLGVFYSHFGSKEDLLGAVLEHCTELSAERLRVALAGVEHPVERIARYLRCTFNVEATPLNVALLRQETALLSTHPAEVYRAQAPLAALVRELIEQAVAGGRIKRKNADDRAYALLAVRRAYHRARLLGEDGGLSLPGPERLVDQCLRSLGITS